MQRSAGQWVSMWLLQGRKLRKAIADMQSSHEAQINAVMDKYHSLRAKVSLCAPSCSWS